MCGPEIAALATVAGTAVQVKATKDQASASAEAAKQNAKQAYIDYEQSKVAARQYANARLEKLDKAMEVNNSLFAFGNRSTDASIKAFQEAEEAIAYKDVDRGFSDQLIAGGQSMGSTLQEIARGKSAIRAGKIQTASLLTSGVYQLSQIQYVDADVPVVTSTPVKGS